MPKIIQIITQYLVEDDNVFPDGSVNPSHRVIVYAEMWDGGKTRFARWKPEYTMVEEYLPGGNLYLGDTWDEAMKKLGVKDNFLTGLTPLD